MNTAKSQAAKFIFALVVVLCAPAIASAQRDAKVPDPDPELERKTFRLPEGFEVNLFAADPQLAKPIQMNFDAAGRLWVACSEAYPQIKPGEKQNDKIIILEDTKGVGKADKVTVFADGLLIPTGCIPGDGGCYVVDSTDLLHLSASKPGEKADRRRVILSGFGTEDTHHMVHTLRWGPDGLLYFNQSIYIHSHLETPHGVRRLNGSGVWQFRPETLELSVFSRGLVNPWGHHFDRWGQSFLTDGAGGEGINYTFPGASFTSAVDIPPDHILKGLNPGSPKDCGLEILSGRHLPEEWRGNLITNDFRSHRVCRYVVTPEGSGYTSREQKELIKSDHPAFRPIDVKMGPDGAIYIADWYNPIIQHGEVDFRDPRRDVTHGRIWRVTAKDRSLVPRPKLIDARTTELLDDLKEPEDWTRHFARLTLRERGKKEVLPALAEWWKQFYANKPENEPHLLEALWTYQALDVPEPKLLDVLLRASDYRVRAAATRVLGMWHAKLTNPLELLALLVADEHPQVRLEAVRALGRIPSARAAEIALVALDRPTDKFLEHGLWLTCRELEPKWMPALQDGKFDYGGNTRRLLFALQASGDKAVLPSLVKLVKDGKVSAEGEEAVLTLIGTLGGPKELTLLFDRAALDKAPVKQRIALLQTLEAAAKERGVKPEGKLDGLEPLTKDENVSLRAAALRLAGAWKLDVQPVLSGLLSDPKTPDLLRRAAIDGLLSLGNKGSETMFMQLCIVKDFSPAQRRAGLVALAKLNPKAATDETRTAAAVLMLPAQGEETVEVFEAFLQQKGGGKLLAAGLKDVTIPADTAKVGIRTARSTGRDESELIAALTKAGKLTFGVRKLSADEMKTMVADVAKKGDAARGEAVYRRKDMVCMKCHAVGGCGGQVGPDLSSIGGSAQVDYLIESILEPNKAVKENYHAMLVTTKQGRQLTGIKVAETKTELILRTAEDREITVPVKDIDEKKMGGSLMPAGLTDTLTDAELIDLVRFLSELGKVGPYSVGKERVVRRWQVLEPTPEARQLLEKGGKVAMTGDDPALVWGAAYSTVSGVLPPGDVPLLTKEPALGFVRAQFDATTPGPVLLRFNGTKGLTLWLDGKPLDAKETTEMNLTAGVHTLTIAVDASLRKDPLRVELDDKPDSPARVHVVGGK
jgi:putative heme-binding domain-containing protein